MSRREVNGGVNKAGPNARRTAGSRLSIDDGWALRVVEASPDLVCLCRDGVIAYINGAGLKMLGFRSTKGIIGRPFTSFVDPGDRDAVTEVLQHPRQDGEFRALTFARRRTRPAVDAEIMVLGEAGPGTVILQARDITRRKEDEERIYFHANYDTLTELPNRALFLDRLNHSLPNAARTGRKLALLFIDLDGFKLINDTLGHHLGDLLLKDASTRLRGCVRSGDTLARLGDDEFTVIMPNLADARHAPRLAQRILDALAKPFDLKGHAAYVSGSIGIAVFPDDATKAGDLIRHADSAMVRAKEHGKANYQFFTSGLNEEVRERLVIKSSLGKALERDELSLHYQPKLALDTGTITGAEALLRWDSPELGPMSPAKFIPVMEETGQIVEVGEWAIRTACLQHKALQAAGLPALRIAVNLSARQLREKSFVAMLEDVLRETGVEPTGLELEITESMLMADADHAVVALGELHDMGIQIAMDDFGTGYSSLSYLKRFPIDTIKIDRSFVADIVTDPDDVEIIKAIVTMGQSLNRRVIAEGVETAEQLSILRRYRCDEIQGYFISRPLPAKDFVAFLRNNQKLCA